MKLSTMVSKSGRGGKVGALLAGKVGEMGRVRLVDWVEDDRVGRVMVDLVVVVVVVVDAVVVGRRSLMSKL